MSPLRWTLLILGVAFVAALALWEKLRPRQARGMHQDTGLRRPGTPAEPWIGETEPEQSTSLEGLRADSGGSKSAHGELAELPTVLIEESEPETSPAPRPLDPTLAIVEALTAETEASEHLAKTDEFAALEEGVGEVRVLDPQDAAAPSPVPEAAPQERSSESPAGRTVLEGCEEPIVEWPPEASRRIVALRLVAPAERFPGRALRLALGAEGFVFGKFHIFHKPDEQRRACLSAASLTRPGAFELDIMDTQRYAGLNLFAVLPGPRPAQQVFEELLAAARNLGERLQGELQDEGGESLTGERIEALRAELGGAHS